MTVDPDAVEARPASRWARRATFVASALAAAVAFWHIGALLRIVASRLAFPMDIEWLEGHALEEAWRTTHAGDLTYGDPSAGYQTQIYTPFYFALVGVIGRVVGLDYATGRAISVIAFLAGCLAAFWPIGMRARDRLRARSLGLVAVGSLCASFPVVGGWYDLARVDSMAIALVLVPAAIVGAGSVTVRRAAIAGLVLAAAVFTKQTNVLFVPWFALYVFAQHRRAAIALVAVFGTACVVAFVGLQLATHGWFWRWMTLATKQTLVTSRLREAVETLCRFAPYLPALFVVVPAMLVKRWASKTTVLWAGLLACALPSGILPFIKAGGAPNNLIPIVAIAPVVACLAIRDLLDRARTPRGAWCAVALAACAAYLFAVRFPVERFLPTESQWTGARELNAVVASREGGIVIPTHPFLARRHHAGGRQLMTMGYIELFMAARGQAVDVAADLERIAPAWLVLSEPGPDEWMRPQVRSRFSPVCRIEPSYATFGSLASDPRLVYRARSLAESERPAGVDVYSETNLGGAVHNLGEGDPPKMNGETGSFALGAFTRARACSDSARVCHDFVAGDVVRDIVADLGGSLSALFVAFDLPTCR